MNKLPKDKRDKLILVTIAVLAVVGTLYTFILGAQRDKLGLLSSQIVGAKDKVSKAERVVRSADIIQEELTASRQNLDKHEHDMAPQGQYYYWFLKLLDQFRKNEGLDPNFILDITQPEFGELALFPNAPYKAAIFGVRVNGHFEEIGKFIASLENTYPYIRVQNLRLQPEAVRPGNALVPATTLTPAANDEELNAEFKVVTMVKPGTT